MQRKGLITTDEQLIPIHLALSQLAKEHPDKTAVMFHGDEKKESLTWGELDHQSTLLAAYLTTHHADKKTIGISLERSPNLYVAMFAAWKAGLCLIPMETNPLDQRDLDKLANKTKLADLMLTDDATQHLFNEAPTEKIINVAHLDTNCDQHVVLDAAKVTLEDPAYIMYTSGSTGAPKAVEIAHKGLANLFDAMQENNFLAGSKILSTADATFDAFYYDIIIAMLTAGELHLGNELRYSTEKITEMVTSEKLNFTALFPEILAKLDPEKLPSLTQIISMGAAADQQTLDKWIQLNEDARVIIGYGPTEGTICSMLLEHALGDDPTMLGTPIKNVGVEILHPETLMPCAPGIVGELYIKGPQLGRYIGEGSDELNEKKFVEIRGSRWYATGDYGSYVNTPRGLEIKFEGRVDRQIKWDAKFHKLDDVENALNQQHDRALIKESAMFFKQQDGEWWLELYIVPTALADNMTDWQAECNRIYEQAKLSKVLIARPHHIHIIERDTLDTLPLTSKGIPDHMAIKALPSVCPERIGIVPPEKNTLEEQIHEIWSNVLGIPPKDISCTDRFDFIGGNSLDKNSIADKLLELPNVKRCEVTLEKLAPLLKSQINVPEDTIQSFAIKLNELLSEFIPIHRLEDPEVDVDIDADVEHPEDTRPAGSSHVGSTLFSSPSPRQKRASDVPETSKFTYG